MAESSLKARRTAARLAAVQTLYSMEMGEGTPAAALRDIGSLRQGDIEEALIIPEGDLLKSISQGVPARLADVDGLVSGALEGRTIDRTEPLLRAILRAGAFELMTDSETAPGIVINDYVNVAHAFYDSGEPAKINAVLDKIAHQLQRQ